MNMRNFFINIITYLNVFSFKKKFKKIIFFHTPQSGGNSIHFFFKLNFGFRGLGVEDHHPPLNSEFYKDFLYLYGHFGLVEMKDIEFRKDYFYLFNIRNPINRYLSNYYRNRDLFSKKNEEYISLENFLELRISQNLDNYYTRYLSGEIVNNDKKKVDDEIFQKAADNIKKINYFFVLENSLKSFDDLRKKLNILLPISNFFTLHKNKVSGSKYPQISNKEKLLLEKLTFYDTQIYNKILNLNNNKNT